ncbi:hypothetical protein AJ80_06645 [Polytolypa hystricis UAMH7299]|uniref:Uncharacterized protein n=1 Tax=Polytolypa hystricis (strain UAMH7299) TaxID=1447883 RepID=A0A2B7XUQ2_POLH7|nr:hypothetical protein AJ80_06645 [Polytolypa hystricis UAMH7299]
MEEALLTPIPRLSRRELTNRLRPHLKPHLHDAFFEDIFSKLDREEELTGMAIYRALYCFSDYDDDKEEIKEIVLTREQFLCFYDDKELGERAWAEVERDREGDRKYLVEHPGEFW